jgi:hypothetical protein
MSEMTNFKLQICNDQFFTQLADTTLARKKSSQKSTRPRGAKDVATFPGAIGRNNACVRADLQQLALGGRKRSPRVGECIVADGWLPCQRQPLRGLTVPSRGANPSTWFVGHRSSSGCPERCSPKRRSQSVFDSYHGDLPRGPLSISPSSWCGKIREGVQSGQGRFSSA